MVKQILNGKQIPTGGASTASVATSQTTTSTSYTDLTTAGPSVTVTIGSSGLALVTLSADMYNGTSGAYAFTSFVVSGGNTVAASDANGISVGGSTANPEILIGRTVLLTGLTAGSTTFKLQYRVSGGTGTFINRNIAVVPL